MCEAEDEDEIMVSNYDVMFAKVRVSFSIFCVDCWERVCWDIY